MNKGLLFVVSGPSGTGKGTICSMILSDVNAELSVSMTTRNPRPGEVDGKSYNFVSKAEFESMIGEDGFLEYAQVYGNYYGTPKQDVLSKLEAGSDVILEIDVQGALQIKKRYPEAVLIFILPPSMAELRNRIKARGSETEDAIKLRMSEAMSEISHIEEYNYYIVNKSLGEAVARAKAVVAAAHSLVTKDTCDLIEKYREEI